MAESITSRLFGRKMIFSDVDEVTAENVVDVLQKAKHIHGENAKQIEALWDVYRGKQEILKRHKEIRSDIENKIVENRAFQFVTFETGYLVGKPIQYISANAEKESSEAVRILNKFMEDVGKSSVDQSLVTWQKICGTGYRLVQQKDYNEPGEAPFELFTVEPDKAFVVYSSRVGHKPLCGVYTFKNSVDKTVYCVYTPRLYFEVIDSDITRSEENSFGAIPLVEYPANIARIGTIELVNPLLEAINSLDSNRLDGVEQFVQSILVFINCLPPEGETTETLAQKGIIAVHSPEGAKADLKMLAEQLDQTQTEVLKQDYLDSAFEIAGIPSQGNGRTSDSSNNGAVILRNGWQAAEAKAEASEQMFRASEREMLRVVLRICRDLSDMPQIKASDVAIKFTRRNYEDIQTKAQVLVSMLNNDKIYPKLAFEVSGLFKDVEEAWKESEDWFNKQVAALEEQLADEKTVTDYINDNGLGAEIK